MRIAMTGGTGSIGPTIVLAARGAGHEVVVVTRRPAASVPGVFFLPGDVTRPETIDCAFAGAEVVIHAAAAVGREATESDHARVTVDGTRNVLAAAIRAGVRRLIHVGSLAVHAPAAVIRETSPLDDRTPHRYARAKRAAESLVDEAARSHGLEVVTLRPGLVLGPGERHVTPRLIGLLGRGLGFLVGDGSNRVPCLTLEDLAGAVLAALENRRVRGPYVLAGAGVVTQADLWRMHARAADLEVPHRVLPRRLAEPFAILSETTALAIRRTPWISRFELLAMTANVGVDTTRAALDLGWRGTGSIEVAVAKAVDALRNAPASHSLVHGRMAPSTEARCES
jgi:nucleoside-diphosphate-sugar epimerase